MVKKRERLQVIFDILKAVRDHNKIGPTRLLYASNLSPQMFKEYTDELVNKEFVTITQQKNKKIFQLTDKGYKFLEEYQTITKFIENFGL